MQLQSLTESDQIENKEMETEIQLVRLLFMFTMFSKLRSQQVVSSFPPLLETVYSKCRPTTNRSIESNHNFSGNSHEWTNYMAANEFCIRACNPADQYA